jgi:hypothetical protein
LKNLDDDMDISRALGSIRGNIKASDTENLGYDFKHYKPWLDKECSDY